MIVFFDDEPLEPIAPDGAEPDDDEDEGVLYDDD
jgi:hypothetical protein